MVTVKYGEVYLSQDGWRFRTLGGNYAKIAWGEGYMNRTDALDACIASCPDGAEVLVRKSNDEPDYVHVVDHENGGMTIEGGPVTKLHKVLSEAE